jgi:hypothetical protein
MQTVKTSVTKLKDGDQNDAVSICPVISSSSSGNRGSHLAKGKKHRSATTPSTQPDHNVDQMQSTKPLSSRLSFTATRLPTDRGNRHQQSSDERTVGVPVQPKHKVPDLIIILGR